MGFVITTQKDCCVVRNKQFPKAGLQKCQEYNNITFTVRNYMSYIFTHTETIGLFYAIVHLFYIGSLFTFLLLTIHTVYIAR